MCQARGSSFPVTFDLVATAVPQAHYLFDCSTVRRSSRKKADEVMGPGLWCKIIMAIRCWRAPTTCSALEGGGSCWLMSRQTRLIAIKVMRVPGNPLDGIVGGGAVSAITYRILNAVRNKTLNSRIFKFVRESAAPISEQENSSLLEIRLAKVQQRIALEIGDVSRFRSIRPAISYCGLCGAQRSA